MNRIPSFVSTGSIADENHCTGLGHNKQVLMTTSEAAAYLRVSKSYFDKLRVYGGGPNFLRFGKRRILYHVSDLDVWAAERCFTSTSEYDASIGPRRL